MAILCKTFAVARFEAVASELVRSGPMPEHKVLDLLGSRAAYDALIQAGMLGFTPKKGPICTVSLSLEVKQAAVDLPTI